MKRAILLAIAFVVMIAAGALYYVYTSLDGIVKAAIERYGSELTGTAVHVGSVELALAKGEGTIHGLRIANPPGYSDRDVFDLREITLEVDPATVRQTPIVIRRISIVDPEVRYEVNAKGVANVNVIKANLARVRSRAGASGGGTGQEREVRFKVGTLVFEGGRIAADTTALGGTELALALPALELRNLGSGSQGDTPSQLGVEALAALSQRALTAVGASELKQKLIDKLGPDAGGAAGRAIDQAIQSDAGQAVERGIDSLLSK